MTIKTGYKATDKNMQCRGLQFVLGEWQSVDGDLVEYKNGLHFCTELAHTYEFYNDDSDRRFECEVEDVLEVEYQPGVISKRVARRVRLTKELTISGNSNTEDCNTGYSNAGNCNTGNSNTGGWNHCDRSAGFFNSIEPKIASFDEISEYTCVEYQSRFGDLVRCLGSLMISDEPIDVAPFAEIPNITQDKLNNLHQKFIESRKKSAM